jgi:RecA-family ATPase
VAGEGMFIVGTRGAGKTNLCMDFALRMSAGLDVIGYQTASPLNVLILQAELPAPFFQHRFNRMVEGYERGNGSGFRESLGRVHIVDLQQPLNLCLPQNRQSLSGWVQEHGARVVILDPFLSFFKEDENSNPEVRDFLDSIKFEVALPNRCGVIITDHVAKSDLGKEPSARGAGAKGDWAATIVNISTKRDPSNPEVRIVSTEISKLRYGLEPSVGIYLRRDPQTLLHSLMESERDMRLNQIRQLLMDQGGTIRSQTAFIRLIGDHLGVGARVARRLLVDAETQGVLEIENGRSNSRVYRLATADSPNSTPADGSDE